MNQKAKKILIIVGLALDVILTILLFVFSVVILAKMPSTKIEALNVDETTFLGWFQKVPLRILLLDVLPLAILLVLNVCLTVWYIKKTGMKKENKTLTIDDLSEEEKAALKQKILQEMMQSSEEKK